MAGPREFERVIHFTRELSGRAGCQAASRAPLNDRIIPGGAHILLLLLGGIAFLISGRSTSPRLRADVFPRLPPFFPPPVALSDGTIDPSLCSEHLPSVLAPLPPPLPLNRISPARSISQSVASDLIEESLLHPAIFAERRDQSPTHSVRHPSTSSHK